MPIFTWVLIHEKPLCAVEVGAYIHRVLFCMGAYYPESTVLGEHRTQHYVREHDSEGFELI